MTFQPMDDASQRIELSIRAKNTHDQVAPETLMIKTYAERDVPASVAEELRFALDEAFPATFDGRIYFKQ